MIVDSSVILRAFFRDEAQEQAQRLIQDHVARRIHLAAPELLMYEICNSVTMAERRGRVAASEAEQILASVDGLKIEMEPVVWVNILPLARRFGCSAYEAAYLALAEARGLPLITCDTRLYHAVQPHLKWVTRIEDY